MSFQFPKPVPESKNTCSGFGSDHFRFRFDEYHFELMRYSGPDYDELIIPLSLYAFNRLSPSDQHKQLEEIRSHHEESSFTELFKKLNYSDQVKFLSKVLQTLKCEKLDTEHQQQVIEQMAHVKSSRYRLDPEETEECFRLRRFGQLYADRTGAVQDPIVAWKTEDDEQEQTSDDTENNSDGKSCFSEFFIGFSIIWFQGQWVSNQDMLIEQLSNGLRDVAIEKRLQNESEDDFKLRRFRELCTKVVDFHVQGKFLCNAEKKLGSWGKYAKTRLLVEPQEYDGAAELFSDISTLGFGLLSAKYQEYKIKEMSNPVGGRLTRGFLKLAKVLTLKKQERHELLEEAIRVSKFRELFNQVSVPYRIDLFRELRIVLLKEDRYHDAVHFFSGLGSEDQIEMINKLEHKIRYKMIEKLVHKIRDSAGKFCCETDKDLRFRRFKEVCNKHLSNWHYIAWPEEDKERVEQGTSDKEEESPYAEFLFYVSITWFKARCANYRRNPIYVILFGEVENRDLIEKLPEESEEDFRLRRFTGSFKQLQRSSQESVVGYIEGRLFLDLGHRDFPRLCGSKAPTEGMGSFALEWIKMKLLNLRDQGAATTTTRVVSAGGSATTTQAGGIVNHR